MADPERVTTDPLDLGHGVTALFTDWSTHKPCGIIETHTDPDGERHAAGIMFDLPGVREAFPGRPVWTLVSLEPLTLHPSILCRACNHHGWIREGRWIPA